MSNYQSEGSAPPEGPPAGGGAYPSGSTSVRPQQPPPTGPPPQWQGQPGYPGQHPGGYGARSQRSFSVPSAFKTTEFWIFVVVSLALLIAAAVTDTGDDNQGFGARDAWRYVTALAIAYMLSRGLTKFGGHERDGDRRRDR